MKTHLRDQLLARLDRLLARLDGLVNADPTRELAPVPGSGWRPGAVVPDDWPEGLPWPLSARRALDAVIDARELLTAWTAADMDAAVSALVQPEVQAAALACPELVAMWRWPFVTIAVGNGVAAYGASYGPRLALGRLVQIWHADLDPVDAGIWPDGAVSHRTVAEWAREPLNRLHPAKPADFNEYLGIDPVAFAAQYPGKPALGDALVADVTANGEIRRMPVLRQASGWPVQLHRDTLALLYLVERDALAELPGNLMRTAWLMVRSWSSVAPGDMHNAAATAALDREVATAAPAGAVDLLARELWRQCPGLVAAVAPTPDPPAFDPHAVPERDGMLSLDADLADWLATLDQGNADKVRPAARKRLADYQAAKPGVRHLFQRWTDGDALAAVAVVLWRVKVAARWKIARRVVAYPRPLVENMATMIAPLSRQMRLDFDGDSANVRLRLGGHTIAAREAPSPDLLENLRTLVTNGADSLTRLGEPDGMQLLVYLQSLSHLQRAADVTDHRVIRVDGPAGVERLARQARLSQDGRKHLRAYLEEMRLWRWPLPGYRTVGGLATWRQTDGGGLIIELSRLAAGEWVEELRELGEHVPAALLSSVPLPQPLWDVQIVGPRLRRKAVAFLLRVWLEMQNRRAELVAGGVALDSRSLDLAEDCGLKTADGEKLVNHWRALGHLERSTTADLWTLGHTPESAYLAEGARRSAAGRLHYERGKAKKKHL